MDSRHLAQTGRIWRDRLAARVVFDLSAAEAAIRQAYRASALPEPSQILWVKGPREAAQSVAFLRSPPRRLRREAVARSEEHTSELQSLMRISYAVFCLKKKKTKHLKRRYKF